MNINPISIVLTLFGGLVLAGILGWIRRPRLVVFVPRLFSHSRISDKGQIAEISVMNRGFKTEEAIELALNPALRYELVGSNNPDAALAANKLAIPRIGSADDCSVLLQVENGKFSKEDIINCLSKETKATIASKLEDIPVTAQQRVGLIMFFCFVIGVVFAFFEGVDYFTADASDKSKTNEVNNIKQREDFQGWSISDIYITQNSSLYKAFIAKNIELTSSKPTLRKNMMEVNVVVKNNSSGPLKLSLSIAGTLPQLDIDLSKRRIFDLLLLPGDSTKENLVAVVPSERTRQRVIVEFFLENSNGDSLRGQKYIVMGEP